MEKQLIPKGGNDCIYTPLEDCRKLVSYFKPKGSVLEPCRGTGNFIQALKEYGVENVGWCEIEEGVDFFDCEQHYDWIITNPPFSKFRNFMKHSMKLSDNIVFLATVNHIWLKARIRDIKEAGFEIKEIVPIDTPKTFPQSGFQVGWIYLKRIYANKNEDVVGKYSKATIREIIKEYEKNEN